MDIERLKELRKRLEYNSELEDEEIENLWELIDEAIARQSATSEEVAEAISWAQGMEILYTEKQMPECANCAKTAITALQEYEPWIPVSERVPEEGAIVMVAYGEAIYFASIQYWGIHGKEVPVWRVGMGHRIEKDFSETHWKPYPEPPKGELA